MTSESKMSIETRAMVARISLAVGLVAAVFVLVICALLTATHLQVKHADPLNNSTLVALRDRYAAGERSDQVKADIRQLDLLARKAFFTSQGQVQAGGMAALIAGVLMLVAFGTYQAAMHKVTPPSGDTCEGMFWLGVQRSRTWLAGGAVMLVALSVVLSLSTPTELTAEIVETAKPDIASAVAQPAAVVAEVAQVKAPAAPPVPVAAAPAKPEPAAEPAPKPKPEPAKPEPAKPEPAKPEPAAVASVFPADFAKQAPVFRGANGTGQTAFDDVPVEWDESEGKNMLWKKDLDYPAWASPVVWGDKVITLAANEEARTVYCLNAATGEAIWEVVVPAHEGATEDYMLDTMDERWDTLMYAGATPAVNGKQVFVQFSNGQLLALDLATGKVLWNIVPGGTSANTYGVANSLLIYKDSVIGVFEGDDSFIARYDAATGKTLWKTERDNPSWSSPILAKRNDGSHLVILPSDPNVTAWDPETGKQVWSTEVFDGTIEYCVGPSPVQVGNMVCVNMQYCGIYGLNLADGTLAWKIDELPDGSGFPDGASMTTDGKHIFQYYESVLTCLDAATGKVVKQRELDEYSNYASALLNKGSLYLPCDGMVLILNADPATDFADRGKGVLDESSDATPAIVKGRVYIRSDESLYCFGAK